jgi:hypothetical protein
MEKSTTKPTREIRRLGFMVNSIKGTFAVPCDRWDILQSCVSGLINARRGRVRARSLASCVGQIVSMRLAVGPTAHFITRHIYETLNSRLFGWSSWVTLSSESLSELR